jgi:hypothetical protein
MATYGRHPHTATHPTYKTTDGYAFETFDEMMAHLEDPKVNPFRGTNRW